MFPPRWRTVGRADASMHRHIAGHHHSDLDPVLARPLPQRRRRTDILKTWWLPVLAGVIAGSIVARYAPERLFKIVFVMVAWSAAARLLLARATWKFGDDLPQGPLMRMYGFFVGILS